jgi:hypothetical protein
MNAIFALELLSAAAGGAWVSQNVTISEEAQEKARRLLKEGRARLPGAIAATTHLALLGAAKLRGEQPTNRTAISPAPVTEEEIGILAGVASPDTGADSSVSNLPVRSQSAKKAIVAK